FTFRFVAIVDMSAMAGYICAGGLGDFAIVYGYRAFHDEVTWIIVLVIIVIVQAAQLFCNWLAMKVMRRWRLTLLRGFVSICWDVATSHLVWGRCLFLSF